MTEFLAELRRRHIFRIGGIYVVVAWGIAQVIDFLSQVFALPDWVAQPVAIVLAIGFPVILIAAWVIVGAAKATDTAAELRKATATDWSLLAALVVIIALIAYQQVSPNDSMATATATTNNSAASVADDIVQDIVDRLPNSIAVLPFENLSPDPDDEYFALGVHEEIINQLSKLRNVNVIARNSVMQYAGGDVPIPEIATQLNVETVMRGSLRYAENQVRVTAQLIDGMTNVPVWTTEDEGDLSNIFAIQSDIAMSIANSLNAAFSVEEQERIEQQPTNSPEAYTLYLRANEILRGVRVGDADARSAIHGLVDDALALDPDFADALALKSWLYQWSRAIDPVTEAEWPTFKMEMDRLTLEFANMALALDPNNGPARVNRAFVYLDNLQPGAAQLEAEEALRVDPNNPEVLLLNAILERDYLGRPEQAVEYMRRVVELDPYNSQYYSELGQSLTSAGRHNEALEAFQKCAERAPGRPNCNRYSAIPEIALGNEQAALESLRLAETLGTDDSIATLIWLAYGYGLLGQADDAQRAFDALEALSDEEYIDPSQWAWAYMGVGNYAEALRQLNNGIENPELNRRANVAAHIRQNIWQDPVLEEPEWIDVRERMLPRG